MMLDDQSRFNRVCHEILDLDAAIHSARLADAHGDLIASAYKKGFSHMSSSESELYSLQSVFRAAMKETFESTNGRLRYSVSVYEHLMRSTIPIRFDSISGDHKFYVLLSFSADSDAISILAGKVLPYIERNKDYFLCAHNRVERH